MNIDEIKNRLDSLKIERRYVPIEELRVEGDTEPHITGYAAVFNALSEDLGGFREQIVPGAFKRTINAADVRALWNHDPNYVLGRNKAGTLSLKEDKKGLAISITPPDAQWARDLLVSMQRGDVDQMSFGFKAIRDSWSGDLSAPVRTLQEVRLFDVSVVTFPAYPQTQAQVRSLLDALSALDMTDATEAEIRSAIEILQSHLLSDPPQEGHSEAPTLDPPLLGHSIAWRARELELLALTL